MPRIHCDALVVGKIRRVEQTHEEHLRSLLRAGKTASRCVSDDFVRACKDGRRPVIPSPVPVIQPFVVVIAGERADERRQSDIHSRPGCNLVPAVTDTTFMSRTPVLLHELLKAWVLGAFETQ